jgi:hypothetical protein
MNMALSILYSFGSYLNHVLIKREGRISAVWVHVLVYIYIYMGLCLFLHVLVYIQGLSKRSERFKFGIFY